MYKHPKFIKGMPFREYFRAYERRKYARLKAAGMCVQCERKKARAGFVTCGGCRRQLKRNSRIHWRRKHITGKDAPILRMKLAVIAKARAKTEKLQALEAYGGAKCVCCGEDEVMLLTLDHIKNDGGVERKLVSKNGRTGLSYCQLRKKGYPPGRQVLCYSCNIGKYLNKGICPHKNR